MPASWTTIPHRPGSNHFSEWALTATGQVLVHDSLPESFALLTPTNGDYANGSWSAVPDPPVSLQYDNAYYPVRDGSLVVVNRVGGQALLFDPTTPSNPWTVLTAGRGPALTSAQLANGTILFLTSVAGACHVFDPMVPDPVSLTRGRWTPTGTLPDPTAWPWVLLASGDVVTAPYRDRGNAVTANRYANMTGTWVSSGPVPNTLQPAEVANKAGAVQLQDERVWFPCAGVDNGVGQTAFFDQSSGWSLGAPLVVDGLPLVAKGSAAALPSGKVMFAAGVWSATGGTAREPTVLVEFDPAASASNAFRAISSPYQAIADTPPGYTGLLVLPTGDVLVTNYMLQDVVLYAPADPPPAAARPVILSGPVASTVSGSYALAGTQFSGLTSGVRGAIDGLAVNQPLVRLTRLDPPNQGDVTYCRTSGIGTLGVAAGQSGSVTFDASTVGAGAYDLEVVSNGIASMMLRIDLPIKTPLPTCRPTKLHATLAWKNGLCWHDFTAGIWKMRADLSVIVAVTDDSGVAVQRGGITAGVIYPRHGTPPVGFEARGPELPDMQGRAILDMGTFEFDLDAFGRVLDRSAITVWYSYSDSLGGLCDSEGTIRYPARRLWDVDGSAHHVPVTPDTHR